jgi:hypothetical protein
MKTFKDILAESFNTQPIKFFKKMDNWYEWTIGTGLEARKYRMIFRKAAKNLIKRQPEETVVTMFGLLRRNDEDENELDMKMTKTGDAVTILSTAFSVLQDYVSRHPETPILFSASKEDGDSKSREKVYERLSKKYFDKTHNIRKETNPDETFFLLDPK